MGTEKEKSRRHSADSTVRNSLNRSSAKAQFSFSKSERFPRRMSQSIQNFTFYDISLRKFDKKITFTTSNRTQLIKKDITPPPGAYEPPKCSQPKITFKASREECRHSSAFPNNKNPGPGAYHVEDRQHYKTINYSIGKKLQSRVVTESPGPKYNIDSTLLDQKKYLSIYVRRNCTKICPPSAYSHKRDSRVITEPTKVPVETEQSRRFVTANGRRAIGLNHPAPVIGRDSKGTTFICPNNFPGPGQYQSFSEFIET